MDEGMSLGDSMFFAPGFEYCIIAIIGMKTKTDPNVMKQGLLKTLVQHPRFSSIVVMDDKDAEKMSWRPATVNLENHILFPNLDRNMDSPDMFVENYISDLTRNNFKDLSKPLWELHVLNVKTSQADSVCIFKIHHSLGDGASLISLLLACTRKTSDPIALPTIPKYKTHTESSRREGLKWFFFAVWSIFMLITNTIVDMTLFVATMFFLNDTITPLRSGNKVDNYPKRFLHRTISLDDMKLVKNAMNVVRTINDLALGMTQAALSRYLARKYENEEISKRRKESKTHFLPNIRLRAAVIFNTRPTAGIEELAVMMEKSSKTKWGNSIGFVLLPFNLSLQDDPLNNVHQVKAAIDRKKHSLESLLTFSSTAMVLKSFGAKVAGYLAHQIIFNTTFTVSNVVGPEEEIIFYGHPVAYIAPSICGHPQALTIHFQGYAHKMTIVLGVDQSVITDPHELCDDFVECFKLIKSAALKK